MKHDHVPLTGAVDSGAESVTGTAPMSPRRRSWVGLVLLLLFLGGLAVHVLLDRFAPYTSEASLQAPVIGVAPNVSGTIVEVAVRDNQPVKAGDLLFRIDPQRFAAAVAQAEASLATASQQVGASTAALAAAEARVNDTTAALENVRLQSARTFELVRRGVAAAAQADTERARIASAEAALQAAQAQLEEARTRLGPEGADNPQIRQALAQLTRARIDLADTEVRAPVDGMVTNTVLSPGQFASAGRPIATVVDTASAWVIADMPENTLANVARGDRVEITFNVLPGRIVLGRVDSAASGVTRSFSSGQGDLARVPDRRRWLRETQRIPVRIELLAHDDIPVLRVGSRASLIIITSEAGWVEPMARAWLRFVALADFVF
jgi:multidrug resistance efflux pump